MPFPWHFGEGAGFGLPGDEDTPETTRQAVRAKAALLRLLPPGRALTRVIGSRIEWLLGAIAMGPGRVLERAGLLIRELVPMEAIELLSDWERLLGLPDDCAPANTLEERQTLVRARFLGFGGHELAVYQAIAEVLLGSALIELRDVHYRPFTCLSNCTDALYQDEWANVVHWVVVTQTGTRVERLECEFNRRKRVHAFFTYSWETP